MQHHPLAGKQVPRALLTDIPLLVSSYYTRHPDPLVKSQRVAFGTSGHRGSSLKGSFNEDHILAITEAICRYRDAHGITGPLFLGKDTHALSEPAHSTALEVLAANFGHYVDRKTGEFVLLVAEEPRGTWDDYWSDTIRFRIKLKG